MRRGSFRGVNDILIFVSYLGSVREKFEFDSVTIERVEFEYTNTRLEQTREPNELFILIYFFILIIYKEKISNRTRVQASLSSSIFISS